jgi:hypothetical protein
MRGREEVAERKNGQWSAFDPDKMVVILLLPSPCLISA